MFDFTADDVARTIIVREKADLVCVVSDYKAEPNKNGDSINHVVDYKCVAAENEEYIGISLRAWFSEKASSMALPFVRAIGAEVPRAGGSVDFNTFKGRKLVVTVKPGTYNNNPINEIIGYRPLED